MATFACASTWKCPRFRASRFNRMVSRSAFRYSRTYDSARLKMTFRLALDAFLAAASETAFSAANFSAVFRFLRRDSGTRGSADMVLN